jgi:hypothetical protein
MAHTFDQALRSAQSLDVATPAMPTGSVGCTLTTMISAVARRFLERQNRMPVEKKGVVVTVTVLFWIALVVGLARGARFDWLGVVCVAVLVVETGRTAVLIVARWRLGPATARGEPRDRAWARNQPPGVRYAVTMAWVGLSGLFGWFIAR